MRRIEEIKTQSIIQKYTKSEIVHRFCIKLSSLLLSERATKVDANNGIRVSERNEKNLKDGMDYFLFCSSEVKAN